MIQKHEIPLLEYDFDSVEVLRPNHGAEQLRLPEKCVFGFLGDVVDDYAWEADAVIAEHFETITKTYPIYIVRQNGLEFCLCQAPLGAPAAAQLLDFLISCGCKKIISAGSCGVLPAVLLPCGRRFGLPREQLIRALYVAAGFGMVIANRASISGAEGGCQAEVGSAAAMAAAALVFLMGGTDEMMANACAMAVKNLLGLVCDPVGGLVEVPCVKRNVIGAMDALSAAQMALAGITSRVPPDQVLDAMREVGDALPHSLKETGKGGLAATPFGKQYAPEL